MSRLAMINACVIEGTVMGSPSFIVEASDLHHIHRPNALMKYADDSYLLVSSNSISTCNATEEFAHKSQWAKDNNLRLDPFKTHEVIATKSGVRMADIPTSPIIDFLIA